MSDDREREPEDPASSGDVDPREFLRALLAISPEDAAKARERASRRSAGNEPDDSGTDR